MKPPKPPRNIAIPTAPSSRDLERILRSSYDGEFSRFSEPAARKLRYASAFLPASEAFGQSVSAENIRRRFGQLRWETTFMRLSMMAATLHAQGILGPYQTELIRGLVTSRGLDPLTAGISVALRPYIGKRAIVHERVLYVMFQLAAEESSSSGRDPSDIELAYLALLLNDHLDRGYQDPDKERSAFASAIALALRFNHRRDALRTLVRTYAILTDPLPARSMLAADPALWEQIQTNAFSGHNLDMYLAIFVYPLCLFAYGLWGKTVAPSIDIAAWYKNASELIPTITSWLEEISTTKEIIAADREQQITPQAPRTLLRTPFVRFGAEHWAASPWAVCRQLHTGIRIHLLKAARRLGKRAQNAWEYTFGFMVEQWAQKVAGWASSGRHFRGRMLLPESAGQEELEDIVWYDDRYAILFSVKSSLMGESQGFNVESDSGVIDWFQRFLFFAGDREKKQRAGAARLLHDKVNHIRTGKTQISSTVTIIPVIVMYDDPLENVGLIDWIHRRCQEYDLFNQPEVCPLLVCNLDSFEAMMGIASNGRHLGHMLDKKQGREWLRERLDVFLAEQVSDKKQFRLPEVESRFREISNHAMDRLRRDVRIPVADRPDKAGG